MANCIRHQMPDGTIMEGPVHGPGQVCVEYESTNGRNNMSYRRRGTARRTPTRGVARRRTPTRGVARRRGAAAHTPGHTQQMMNQNRTMNNGGYRRGGASRVSSLRGRRGATQQYNPSQEANFINAAGVPYYCPPGHSYGSGFCIEKSPLNSQFSS